MCDLRIYLSDLDDYNRVALSRQLLAVSFKPMKDFRELKVWQKAHQLTLAVYRVTADFPRQELYGLTSQLRRSS